MTQPADVTGAPARVQPVRELSLEERVGGAGVPADLTGDAARLLAWWESSYFPGRPKLFTRRLRAAGLNRQTVLPLLVAGRAGGRVGDAGPYAAPAPPAAARRAAPADEPVGFGVAFGRFLESGWREVLLAIEAAGNSAPGLSVDAATVHEHFRAALFERLVMLSLQTFTLRMHGARLLGRLSGETPAARFQNWVRTELADPLAVRRLLDDYPVLDRAMREATAAMARAWAELLERLAGDWAVLRSGFGCAGADDCLTGVIAGLGDTHAGGRSVMRLMFSSGWSVVYKPRSLAVDVHVQELLGWLNQQGLDPTLRCLRVVDRGDHGWAETVEPKPCDTEEQVRRFYRRQGALLFVLYLLDASDIHSENVMASGDQPVLVDLETLFQVPPARDEREARSSAGVREQAFHASSLRTLFLPLPSGGTVGFVDLGGLSDLDGQLTPNRVLDLIDPATDDMRIVFQRRSFDAVNNMPRLDDRVIPAREETDEIVAGFTSAYRLVLAHRSELTASGGPLDRFRHDRVRHVLRNSSDYAMLLISSFHPSCLRDGVRRSFVFDALWLDTTQRSYLERLIPSERRDLWDGDVPLFTAQVDGTDLADARGRVLPGFFATTGLERVMARVAALSEDDLARQVVAVRGSLAVTGAPAPSPPVVAQPARESKPDELLEAATGIGERLVRLAIRVGGEAHWTGTIPLATGSMYTVVDPDLYGGTAGIALFLAYLAKLTGRADFEQLAREAYRGVGNHLRTPDLGRSVGAFAGVPGLQYAALHLSKLWGDDAIADDVRASLDHVRRQVPRDGEYDIHGGAAGCLVVMLRIWESMGLEAARDTASACGRLLLRRAEAVADGIAWTTRGGRKPLLGLSHGGGGIAWALSELAVTTGDARFTRAARRAVAYENARFEAAIGNWPDLRVVEGRATDEAHFMWAWCHGAPGIGIARLRTRLGDGRGRESDDVRDALKSTEKFGFGGAHCLCHGDLGNADLFQLASEALEEPHWRREALWRAHGVLADTAEIGAWRCSGTNLVEAPGLLAGLSGIGYGLLRLAFPTLVPSVLALEGPRGYTPAPSALSRSTTA